MIEFPIDNIHDFNQLVKEYLTENLQIHVEITDEGYTWPSPVIIAKLLLDGEVIDKCDHGFSIR